MFDIDATTGNVTFKASPDFENPQDQGKSNHYDFGVTTTDRAVPGTFQISGAIVTDVNDNEYDIQVSASGGLLAHDLALHVAIVVSDVLLL